MTIVDGDIEHDFSKCVRGPAISGGRKPFQVMITEEMERVPEVVGQLCELMALMRYDGGLEAGEWAHRIEEQVNELKKTYERPVT